MLGACLALGACGEEDEPARPAARPDPARELVTALRRGGHVLLLRHTRTGTDMGPESLESCDKQRNLSADGREDARAMGAAARRSACRSARCARARSAAPATPPASRSAA